MKRRGIVLIGLALCLFFALGFLSGANAAGTRLAAGELYVGGQDIVQAVGLTIAGGSGTAALTYDGNDNPILTLNNYSYSGSNDQLGAIVYEGTADLTIILEKTNDITYTRTFGSGISCVGNMTISGSGSLKVQTKSNYGINCKKDLTINGGTITASGGNKSDSCGGIYCQKNLTINGGTVTASGGNTNYNSYGIYCSGKLVIHGGTVNATGGTVNATLGNLLQSIGMQANDQIQIDGGTVTATGGKVETSNTNSSSIISFGIKVKNQSTISGGTVKAIGGSVAGSGSQSCGIYSVSDSLTISGGTVISVSSSEAGSSCGIDGLYDLTISGGTVIATGNKYGIKLTSDLTLGENAKLTASGGSEYAIIGTVKTVAGGTITGSGWKKEQGTEVRYDINIDSTGVDCRPYYKVGFPQNAPKYEEYPLWVGGTQVSSWNMDDVLGDADAGATVKYDPEQSTLTLTSATISGGTVKIGNDTFYAAILANMGLTINVVSDSTVTGPDDGESHGIYAYYSESLTINGSGTLTARGGKSNSGSSYGVHAGKINVNAALKAEGGETLSYSYGVYVSAGGSSLTINENSTLTAVGGTAGLGSYGVFLGVNTLTVEGNGRLNAKGGTAHVESYGIYSGSLGSITVNGYGTLTAEGGTSQKSYGVCSENDHPIAIKDNCTVTAKGGTQAIYGPVKNAVAGAGWKNGAGNPEAISSYTGTGSGQTLEYLQVKFPCTIYPLFIGDTQVTSAYLTDKGTFSDESKWTWKFVPADTANSTPATLTLNGYDYSGEGAGINYQETGTLIIVLTGSNTIKSTNKEGIIVGKLNASETCDLVFSGDGSLAVIGYYEGIYVANSITFNGGTISAEGGKGIVASNGSIILNGGSVTATGTNKLDGYGIFADSEISIGDKVSSVVASGPVGAIKGNVTSPIFGTGWTDMAGSEGVTTIEPSGIAQITTSRFQKVQFPGVHLHSFTYEPAQTGDSVTVKCTNTYGKDDCTVDKDGVKLTIKAPESLFVDGQAKTATLDGLEAFNKATEQGLTADQITYASIDPVTQEPTVLTSAPTTPGTYSATLIYGEKETESIKTSYTLILNPVTITGADQTVTYTAEGIAIPEGMFTIPEGAGAVSYAVGGDTDTGAGTYDAQTGKLTVTRCGTITVCARTAETATHAASAEKSAVLTVNKAEVTIAAKDQIIRVGDAVPSLAEPVAGTHYTVTGLTGKDTLVTAPTLVYQKNGEAAVPDNTVNGTYEIVPSGASAGDNYNITYQNGKLTITDKLIQTITASDVSATYDDTDKRVSATTDGDGAISYAVKEDSADYIDVNASTGVLTIKKTGTATVTVTAAETEKYAQATKDVTVTIGKAKAVPATVTANSRTWDGTEKPLVIVDASTLAGGEMRYALGTDETTEPSSGWSVSIPSAAKVGTWYVWYKVVGDANHSDIAPACVTTEIKKADMTVTATGYTGIYDGKAHGITVDVTVPAGGAVVKYGTAESTYDLDVSPTITDAAASPLKVFYQVTADGYNPKTGYETVTITKAAATVTKAPTAVEDLIEDGKAHELVKAGTAEGGTLQYALKDNGTTAPESGWSAAIPTADDAGTYYVWYKAVGDANHSDSAAVCVTAEIKQKEETGIPAIVSGCYRYILGREPDEAGKAYWIEKLESGEMTACGLMVGFFESDECKAKGNMTDEAFIVALYRTMMNREPDPSGKAYWMAKLGAGSKRQEVIDEFCRSVEFSRISTQTGIKPDSGRENPAEPVKPAADMRKIRAFVARCYQSFLGREPDVDGLYYWADRLGYGGLTAVKAIEAFVTGDEFLSRKLSTEDTVEALYRVMLNRAADPEGKAHWVTVLDAGNPIAVVINGIASSPEFKGICEEYGMVAGRLEVAELPAGMIPEGEITVEVPAAEEVPEDVAAPAPADRRTEQARAFVVHCYKSALNRDPGAEEADYYVNQILTGQMTAKDMARAFAFSQEFQGKWNDSTAFVRVLYRLCLDREADADGLVFWTDKLAGGESTATVFNALTETSEFVQVCAKYGVPAGVNANPIRAQEEAVAAETETAEPASEFKNQEKIRAFVSRFYRDAMGREADEEGLNFFTGKILNGETTPKDVAKSIILSDEFRGKMPGNEELVKILYRVYLGREADEEGLANWVGELDNGTSLETVLNGFAGSEEFAAVVNGLK